MNSILYGVVVEFKDGGQNMNSFLKKESAVSEANKLVKQAKDKQIKGLKIYFSELEYDEYRNKLISSNLVNNDSELLFTS